MSGKKNKLLILDVNPYGVLTDTVKWIEYLRRDWRISLVSFRSDNSEENRPSDVKFIELPNSKNRNVKGILFLLVFNSLYGIYVRKNSKNFVSYLRKQGIDVGGVHLYTLKILLLI